MAPAAPPRKASQVQPQRSPTRDWWAILPAHAAVQDAGEGPARPRRSPGSLPGWRRLLRAGPGGWLAPAPLLRLSGCSSLPRAPGSLRLALALSQALAPSGGAHRSEPPTEVSVLRAKEEAERGSRPHTRRARHPVSSDSLAAALRGALMRGGGGSGAHACRADFPPPRDAPRHQSPSPSDLGGGEWQGCGLPTRTRARENRI